MSKIRNCAMILGLAGVILMTASSTKDVKATERITYESDSKGRIVAVGTTIKTYTEQKINLLLMEEEKQEREENKNREAGQEQTEKRVYEISEADYTALVRLVEAEASGEDMKGKMLVANVVLNRVEDPAFPDSVEAVVYQEANGQAQFSPVATGKIHKVNVSEETIEAVERVLCGEDESQGALFFLARAHANPKNAQWFDNHLTWLFAYKGHEFYA